MYNKSAIVQQNVFVYTTKRANEKQGRAALLCISYKTALPHTSKSPAAARCHAERCAYSQARKAKHAISHPSLSCRALRSGSGAAGEASPPEVPPSRHGGRFLVAGPLEGALLGMTGGDDFVYPALKQCIHAQPKAQPPPAVMQSAAERERSSQRSISPRSTARPAWREIPRRGPP